MLKKASTDYANGISADIIMRIPERIVHWFFVPEGSPWGVPYDPGDLNVFRIGAMYALL